MADSAETESHFSSLEDVLAEYLRTEDGGKKPNPQEFLERYPEHRQDLEKFFKDQSGVDALVRPLLTAGPAEPPIIDNYDILEPVGPPGGMGMVYKARDKKANRLVALKVIRADRLDSLSGVQRHKMIERFIAEGQAAAQLDHENIVKVYQVGEWKDQPFYVMRYIEGASLAGLIQDGPLEPRRAAAYMEQVARGLHEGHQHGVLHRDMKPQNVMVEAASDRPMVVDYGLAKLTQTGQDQTATGDLMGTPPYMSPEQAQSAAKVTVASDVYSLGATLYALLTGRPPFQGETPIQTLRQVVDEQPTPPSKVQPGIPRDLETICLKCLEKEPGKRYGSAEALAEDLQSWRESRPIKARPATFRERAWKWAKRRPAAAALLVVSVLALSLVLGGGSVLLYRLQDALGIATSRRTDLENTQKELEDKNRDIKTQLRQVETGRYSLQVAFGWQLIEAGDPLRARTVLEKTFHDLRGFEYYHLMSLCKNRVRVVHDKPAFGFAFSPDGKRFATADWREKDSKKATIRDLATGKEVQSFLHPYGVLDVAFDNHGNLATYCMKNPAAAVAADKRLEGFVKVWNTLTKKESFSFSIEVQLPWNFSGIPMLTMSSDGNWVALGFLPMEKERPLSDAYVWNTKKEHKSLVVKGGIGSVQFSQDNMHVAIGSQKGQVDILELPSGKKTRTLEHSKGWAWAGAFFGKGKLATLSVGPEMDRPEWDGVVGETKIWEVKSGKELLRVDQFGIFAAFSPDGRHLALGGGILDEQSVVRILDAQSGNVLSSCFGNSEIVTKVIYHKDGQWLAAAGFDLVIFGPPKGQLALWYARPQASVTLTGPLKTFAFSRDGQRVVSVNRNGQSATVWNATNGQRLITLESPGEFFHDAAFTSDVKRVATVTMKSGNWWVQVWDAKTGARISANNLGLSPKARGLNPILSPNGERIACFYDMSKEFGPEIDGIKRQYDKDVIPHRLIQVSTGNILNEFAPPQYLDFRSGAFSDDGQRFAVCLADGIRIVGTEFFIRLRAKMVSFGNQDRVLAGLTTDGIIKLWDSQTGRERHQINIGKDAHGFSLNPDATRLASVHEDGRVILWDVFTGHEVFSFKASPSGRFERGGDTRKYLLFSPDGRRLAVQRDGGVEIWTTSDSSGSDLFLAGDES